MGGVAIFPPVTPAPIEDDSTILARRATLGDILAQKQQRQQAVQENAIKLQQMQEAQAAQQKLDALWRQNNGDMSKTLEQAPGAGIPLAHYTAAQKAYQDLKDKMATNQEAVNRNNAVLADQLAGRFQTIKNLPPDQQSAAWPEQLQQAIANKEITHPENYPQTYPGTEWIDQHLPLILGMSKAQKEVADAQKAAADAARAKHDQAMYPAQESAEVTKAALDRTKAAGQELAASDSQPVWDTVLAKYPGAGQQFGTIYSPEAAKRAGEFTITPEQRNQAAATQTYRDELNEARQERLGKLTDNELYMKATDPTDPDSVHARRALDLKEQERLAGSPGRAGGANSLRTYITNEGKLNRLRSSLGTAIATGKTYVDRNGGMKPMSVASGGDEATAATLMEEMKNRFQDTTDELKGVIEDKNNAIAKNGGIPSISTQQAHAALDAGTQKLFNPQAQTKGGPPAAAKPATPPVTGKVKVKTSKGVGFIPRANLERAKQLDPTLQVLTP